jgi:hypothetical protein
MKAPIDPNRDNALRCQESGVSTLEVLPIFDFFDMTVPRHFRYDLGSLKGRSDDVWSSLWHFDNDSIVDPRLILKHGTLSRDPKDPNKGWVGQTRVSNCGLYSMAERKELLRRYTLCQSLRSKAVAPLAPMFGSGSAGGGGGAAPGSAGGEAEGAAGWPCEACTVINPTPSASCNVCGAAKDGAVPGAADPPPAGVNMDSETYKELKLLDDRDPLDHARCIHFPVKSEVHQNAFMHLSDPVEFPPQLELLSSTTRVASFEERWMSEADILVVACLFNVRITVYVGTETSTEVGNQLNFDPNEGGRVAIFHPNELGVETIAGEGFWYHKATTAFLQAAAAIGYGQARFDDTRDISICMAKSAETGQVTHFNSVAPLGAGEMIGNSIRIKEVSTLPSFFFSTPFVVMHPCTIGYRYHHTIINALTLRYINRSAVTETADLGQLGTSCG